MLSHRTKWTFFAFFLLLNSCGQSQKILKRPQASDKQSQYNGPAQTKKEASPVINQVASLLSGTSNQSVGQYLQADSLALNPENALSDQILRFLEQQQSDINKLEQALTQLNGDNAKSLLNLINKEVFTFYDIAMILSLPLDQLQKVKLSTNDYLVVFLLNARMQGLSFEGIHSAQEFGQDFTTIEDILSFQSQLSAQREAYLNQLLNEYLLLKDGKYFLKNADQLKSEINQTKVLLAKLIQSGHENKLDLSLLKKSLFNSNIRNKIALFLEIIQMNQHILQEENLALALFLAPANDEFIDEVEESPFSLVQTMMEEIDPRDKYLYKDGYRSGRPEMKSEVVELQEKLNEMLNGNLEADGYYGPDTVAAVEQAQRVMNFQPQGERVSENFYAELSRRVDAGDTMKSALSTPPVKVSEAVTYPPLPNVAPLRVPEPEPQPPLPNVSPRRVPENVATPPLPNVPPRKVEDVAAVTPVPATFSGTTPPLPNVAPKRNEFISNLNNGEGVFPLKTSVPGFQSGDARRYYGAYRTSTRMHAGVDLVAPAGTKVYASRPGIIREVGHRFYKSSVSVVVEHDDGTVIRYGEVKNSFPAGIKVGERVEMGQHIGYVSRDSGMLHLEMFRNPYNTGRLYNPNSPFKRRDDLLDPTTYMQNLHDRMLAQRVSPK